MMRRKSYNNRSSFRVRHRAHISTPIWLLQKEKPASISECLYTSATLLLRQNDTPTSRHVLAAE
jgi:hypothetical protein